MGIKALPTEPSSPLEDLGDYTMLIFGREKVGKTTFCSQFPNALFCMFERGTKALSVYEVECAKWIDFKQTIKLLKAGDHEFKTVILDTAEEMFDRCLEYVCAKEGMGHPSEQGYGKGWAAVATEFKKCIRDLEMAGFGIVFISHEAERTFETRDGTEMTQLGPSITKTARKVIEPMVDIWAYYGKGKGNRRYLQIVGDDLILAGHRLEDRFVGIESIDCGSSSTEAFANFLDGFNTTESEPATPRIRKPSSTRRKKKKARRKKSRR